MQDPKTLRYQPFYCEENVFHLCMDSRLAGRAPSAVFVTGRAGECVMWGQKQAPRRGAALAWDYHVFCLVRDPWECWDLDTTLGCPIAAEKYLRLSFRPEVALPREHEPTFRVVGAADLAATFASDRAHMRLPDGSFTRPPPPWPPIGPEGAAPCLDRFLTMDDPIAGEVLSLAALLARVEST